MYLSHFGTASIIQFDYFRFFNTSNQTSDQCHKISACTELTLITLSIVMMRLNLTSLPTTIRIGESRLITNVSW